MFAKFVKHTIAKIPDDEDIFVRCDIKPDHDKTKVYLTIVFKLTEAFGDPPVIIRTSEQIAAN